MFCPKCGTKALDGATFCQKCGAKLIVNDATQQAATSTPVQPTQSQNVPLDAAKKKKSKKLPIIIGAVALVIVAVIVIAMNWNGEIDYEATVRAHQPFNVTQGLPYTYGEVLDKYISSPNWKVRKSGDVNYVDISGKAKGTDNELVVTIKVTEDPRDPDLASIAPESVTIDGEKSPTKNDATRFLLAMFTAYDERANNLSDLLSGTQVEVSLTKTYLNETDGIAFKYPSDWTVMEGTELYETTLDDTAIVCLYAPEGFGSASNVLVNRTQADYTLFDYSKADFEQEFSAMFDKISVTDLSNVNIDGVPALELRLIINTEAGPLIVVRYYYIVGNFTYVISGSAHQSDIDSDGRIIDAIMESYTITDVNTSGESGTLDNTQSAEMTNDKFGDTTDQVLFYGIPVQNIIGMSEDEVIANFGEPKVYSEDVIGYGSDDTEWISFDVSYGNTVSGFTASPENFTFNGQSLDQNYDTMVTILGDKYVEQGGTTYVYSTAWYYDGCQISFRFPTYRNETEDDKVVDVSVYPVG